MKTIQYKRGPIKISAPQSNGSNSNSNSDSEDVVAVKTGEKRGAAHSSADRPSARRRKVCNDSTSRGDTEMKDAPPLVLSRKRDEPDSFIEKVRRDKEIKTQQQQSPTKAVATSPTRNKISIADYRASRGLPPLPSPSSSTAPTLSPQKMARQNSSGTSAPGSSSLFINRKKPAVSVSKENTLIAEEPLCF